MSGMGVDELAIYRLGILGKESSSEGCAEVGEGEDAREGHKSEDDDIREHRYGVRALDEPDMIEQNMHVITQMYIDKCTLTR